MKKMIKISAVFLIVIMALSLAACGANSSSGGGEAYSSYDYDYAPAPAADSPMVYSEAIMADSSSDYAAVDNAGGISGTVGRVSDNRKITFSASYNIETKRFDEDYNSIVKLVDNSNGYIANENTDSRSYYSGTHGRNSFFSLRIPIDKYDTFLNNIAEIGDVVNKNKSSEDLTSEYFDTEARIELLNMRKDRLIEYIETATDPEVIIEFERELSNVLYDLDFYEGNKRRLDQLVDYATVEVSLIEVITAETIGKDGEPLGERAQDAFDMSLNGVQEFLQNAAVFFAGAAPVIGLIVLIFIIVLIIRKIVLKIRDAYDAKFPGRLQRKQMIEEKKMQVAQQKMLYQQQLKMKNQPGTYYGQSYPAQPVQQPVQPPAPQTPEPVTESQPATGADSQDAPKSPKSKK